MMLGLLSRKAYVHKFLNELLLVGTKKYQSSTIQRIFVRHYGKSALLLNLACLNY